MHQANQVLKPHQRLRSITVWKAALLSLLLLTGSNVFALDVNKANSAELQTIEGVGPVIAERILRERSRGGKFTSTANLIERVKGVGDKTARRITSGSGLKKGTSTATKKKASTKTATSETAKNSSDRKSTSKTTSSKTTSTKKSGEQKSTSKSYSNKTAAKQSTTKKASKKKASTKSTVTKSKTTKSKATTSKTTKKPAKKSSKKSKKKKAKKKSKKKSSST